MQYHIANVDKDYADCEEQDQNYDLHEKIMILIKKNINTQTMRSKLSLFRSLVNGLHHEGVRYDHICQCRSV